MNSSPLECKELMLLRINNRRGHQLYQRFKLLKGKLHSLFFLKVLCQSLSYLLNAHR